MGSAAIVMSDEFRGDLPEMPIVDQISVEAVQDLDGGGAISRSKIGAGL
jgi:hypothetical protein